MGAIDLKPTDLHCVENKKEQTNTNAMSKYSEEENDK